MDKRIMQKKCYLCGSILKKRRIILGMQEKSITDFIVGVYDICHACMRKNPVIRKTFETIGGLEDNESIGDHARMFDLIENIKYQSLKGSSGVL